MQKLLGLRGLEGFRSLLGSTSNAAMAANPKPSDAGGSMYGSFNNLKITTEKLVEEQASVKTDLEMAHTKLRRATEQINLLEGKLQQAVNENAKLKVKQTEDSKLWQGLDSKVSSTKTLCDQLTETLQQLATQTERAEEDKKLFQEMLGKSSTALDEFNCLLHVLSTKLESAEQTIIPGKHEMLQIKQEKEEMDRSYNGRLKKNDTTLKEKDSLIKQLEGSIDDNKARLICLDSHLQCMEQELKLKDDVCIGLKKNLASIESEKHDLELLEDSTLAENHKQELLEKILKLESDNGDLLVRVQSIMDEKSNNVKSLRGEISKLDLLVDTLENVVNQLHNVLHEKEQLYSCSVVRVKTLEEIQVEASLAVTECLLIEAKKQYDLMLEGTQIELSKHLKEPSLKNHQAIKDICNIYEIEEIKISNAEKEKAEKLIREMENKYNEKISGNKQDSERYLMYLDEHGATVARIHQDNEHKESTLRDYHKEELQRVQSQAENELREECTDSSLKRRDLYEIKEHGLQLVSPEIKRKDVKLSGILQSLISNILREAEKGSQDIPKHRKVTHHEYEVEIANGRFFKRSLHSIVDKAVTKARKDPGNSATIILDPEKKHKSRRSYKRAILKARAWCRAHGIYHDLSKYLGPGAEIYTTPAKGTFHMTFKWKDSKVTNKYRKLTFFIRGRDLYLKGWRGDIFGLFEIQSTDKDQQMKYIDDPTCVALHIGENYNDLCHQHDVANVRIGPIPMIESLEVLYKCDGVITTDTARAVAVFSVNTSEAIRIEDVLEEILESFLCYDLDKLGKTLAKWVRKYGHYSEQYMRIVDCLLRGKPVPDVENSHDLSVKSLLELSNQIKVPLRSVYNEGKFAREETAGPDVWCPPYPDDKGDYDNWAPEDEEEEEEDDEEAKEEEEDEEDEEEEEEKAQMTFIRDHFASLKMCSSISRFITAATFGGRGQQSFSAFAAPNRMNAIAQNRSFSTASGMMRGREVKSNILWGPQRLPVSRKVLRATRFLRWFV